MSVILVLAMIVLVLVYPFVQKRLRGPLRSLAVTETTAGRNVKVWAVKQTGLYYCPDSKLYQKVEPGRLMTQERALEEGYRRAGGERCR